MKSIVWLIIFCFAGTALAQDYNVNVRTKSSGYSNENFPFPDGVKVYDLVRQPHILKPEGLTLIQIWGTCCGGEPEVYSRVENLYRDYGNRGLDWISVNFENGMDYAGSVSEVEKYYKDKAKPEKLFTDPLGYTIDFLQVTGFPTYFLVDKDGTVVFRTNGKDNEGMAMLEGEIQRRVQ